MLRPESYLWNALFKEDWYSIHHEQPTHLRKQPSIQNKANHDHLLTWVGAQTGMQLKNELIEQWCKEGNEGSRTNVDRIGRSFINTFPKMTM